MLKSRTIEMAGKDQGLSIRLTELPALLADQHARAILRQLGEEPDGGIAALAFKFSRDASKMPDYPLLAFVEATVGRGHERRALDVRADLKDWRNIDRIQQQALLLHVDFMIGREELEIPVTFQAQNIMAGGGSVRATFCSPQIAAVLDSQHSSYRELETVLSTENVFDICEIINIAAVREWNAQQALK